MEALKPEAAHFHAEDGMRTAIVAVDMTDSQQPPATFEPLLQAVGASIHVTPEMNGDEVQRVFKEAGK